jgi:hypothetical protein
MDLIRAITNDAWGSTSTFVDVATPWRPLRACGDSGSKFSFDQRIKRISLKQALHFKSSSCDTRHVPRAAVQGLERTGRAHDKLRNSYQAALNSAASSFPSLFLSAFLRLKPWSCDPRLPAGELAHSERSRDEARPRSPGCSSLSAPRLHRRK